MSESNDVLNDFLNEIAYENNLQNPKISILKTVRNGFLGIPNKIEIEGTVENETKKKIYLHLKLSPKLEVSSESVPYRDIFLNESVMYTDVLPKFLKFQEERGVSQPFDSFIKCYRCSMIDKNEFLIFEDLVKSDFVMWDKIKPMTLKSIEFVFKEIAKLHAVSFAMRDQCPEIFSELHRKLNPSLLDFFKSPSFLTSYKRNGEIFLKCIDSKTDNLDYTVFKHFIENNLINAIDCFPNPEETVIIHGDSWCNNFMFKFKDPNIPDEVKEMKYLDWQLSRLSSPVMDLCYFFYCNGSIEAIENLEHYLQIYHKMLSTNLKEMGCDVEKIFPLTTLHDHWKKYSRFGLFMVIALFNVYYNPKLNEAFDLHELSSKKSSDIFEEFVNSENYNNGIYSQRMRNIVKHFVQNKFI